MSETNQSTLRQARVLTEVVDKLANVSSLEEITRIVAEATRALTGADGATFVLKENDLCYYVDENAISPLWKGHRFPLTACISGWSMIHREVVVLQDIYKDDRIPHDAYRPTFVKSLCMVPIRVEDPIGAIGNYWAQEHTPTAEDIKVLQILANSTAIAIQNLTLKQDLIKSREEHGDFQTRAEELEMAIHTVAHDLRSPVAAMMGLAELLTSHLEDSKDETIKVYLQTLTETGQKATAQIEKMLYLYRITHSKLEVRYLDMSTMALQAFKNLSFNKGNRKVQCQIDGGLHAYGDETLIRLVLENLFSNALKYSSKKEETLIQFGCQPSMDGMNTFFVKDNGQGFQSEKSNLLFRPLARLHSEQEYQGTGLGLASVARIIEMHGGSVKAEAEYQKGATFYFSLPLTETA